jgi:hypothetical protein
MLVFNSSLSGFKIQTVEDAKEPALGFGDPLEDFKILIAVRQISSTMDSEFAALEDRIRKISHSSDEQIGDEPARTARYIDQDADG